MTSTFTGIFMIVIRRKYTISFFNQLLNALATNVLKGWFLHDLHSVKSIFVYTQTHARAPLPLSHWIPFPSGHTQPWHLLVLIVRCSFLSWSNKTNRPICIVIYTQHSSQKIIFVYRLFGRSICCLYDFSKFIYQANFMFNFSFGNRSLNNVIYIET